MNSTLLRATLTGAAILALTGCAATPADVPPAGEVVDSIYVDSIRGEYPALFAEVTDGELVGLGRAYCGALDGGTSARALIAASAEHLAPEPAAWVLGSAIAAYCPEHTDALH